MSLKMEMVPGRSFTIRGMRKVFRRVQRVNAVTHSFTIHVTLNASGRLPERLPIVLYEPAGVPKNFDQQITPYQNLHVYHTKSGWMTKEIAKNWMSTIFLPMVENGSVLILDSWKGFNEMKTMPELQNKNLHIFTLPEGTTSVLQPADVFFNRTLKHFIRKLSTKIRRLHNEFTLAVRINILKLLDLVHNQFKAPRFRTFLLYSWYAAGYESTHPPPFETPIQFCMQSHMYTKCEIDSCDIVCMLRCAYCSLYLCFQHIIDHRH